jgi:hypothetical protein
MSTTYDYPNRESVGLAPIWTGAGDEPPPEGETTKATTKKAAKKDAPDEDA